MFSFLVIATYMLFIYLSSYQLKLKSWPWNKYSLFGLPSGRDRLETEILTMPTISFCFLIFWPFFKIWKSWTNYHSLDKLHVFSVLKQEQKVLFYLRDNSCFTGRQWVSDLSDIIPLCTFPSRIYTRWIRLCQTHQEADFTVVYIPNKRYAE